MYLGHIVEVGKTETIIREPLHPYTKALISAVPIPDPKIEKTRKRLELVGDVPSPIDPPKGCTFHTRCPEAVARCKVDVPELRTIEPGHDVACHLVEPKPEA
jgi:oligopeptide/dipeptide ABC transporter ATP-binding protein